MARAGEGVRRGAAIDRRLRRSSVLAAAGDGIVAVALPLLATRVTRDPLAIAVVIAAQYVPWVLVELLAPKVRTDRRTLLGVSDTARGLALGALGAVALVSQETILSIQLAAVVVGLGEAITDRAESEVTDVGRVVLPSMAALALGLVLGGLLYELYPSTPLLADLLVYTLASTFALAVRRPMVAPRAVATRSLPRSSPQGPPGLGRVLTAAGLASTAAGGVLAVLVLFALDDLGLGAPGFGLLLAGLALAIAAGGLVATELGHLLGVRPAMVISLATAGLGTAGAALLADPGRPWAAALALAAAVAAGASAAVLARAHLTRLAEQEQIRPALDRLRLVSISALPVGAVLAGWLAQRQAIDATILQTSIPWIVAAVAAAIAASPAVSTPGMPRAPGTTALAEPVRERVG